MAGVPVLGYWDIRGLAQPIRLVLAHTGVQFTEKRYKCGPPPDFDGNDWLKEKFQLDLDFPNLPYFIHGDLKITQSEAILRYLAKQHFLDGNTDKEKLRIDIAALQLKDDRQNFSELCYSPDYENLKQAYLDKLPSVLKSYSDFLAQRKWFAGINLSFADFMIYDFFDQLKAFAPGCLKGFSNLEDFVKKFETLPNVLRYMNSEKYIRYPFNGDMALFGSRLKPLQ